jgi:hypothetical protein
MTVNLQVYIELPSNPAAWTDSILNLTYSQLAERSFDDFNDIAKPTLFGLTVRKEDYGHHCDQNERPRPVFWFGTETHSQRDMRREKELRRWMQALFDGPRISNAELVSRARQEFPGISLNAIRRAKAAAAPESWRKGGAPGKVRRSRL